MVEASRRLARLDKSEDYDFWGWTANAHTGNSKTTASSFVPRTNEKSLVITYL